MRKLFLLLLLPFIFPGMGYSQGELYHPANLPERIEYLGTLGAAVKISDDIELREPLPLKSHTPEDSLGLQYRTYRLQSNSVRFDPSKIKQVFPEVVTTHDGRDEVDYISLIPVLLEALSVQQEKIRELNERIVVLENAVIKQ